MAANDDDDDNEGGALKTARGGSLFKRAWRAYERFLGRVLIAASHGNRRLGMAVARRPRRWLAVSLGVAALFCVGWANLRFETNADKLWCERGARGAGRGDAVAPSSF